MTTDLNKKRDDLAMKSARAEGDHPDAIRNASVHMTGFMHGWDSAVEELEKEKDILTAGYIGIVDKRSLERDLYRAQCEKLADVLSKIADPRKRDHKEPDTYTELGCVMNMAEEALADYEKFKKEME